MSQSLPVRVMQRIGESADNLGRLAKIKLALGQFLFERAAFNEGGNDKGLLRRAADFVHAHDIRMVKRRRELRLANESLAIQLGLQNVFPRNLDGHDPLELCIECPVDDTERSASDLLLEDAILTEINFSRFDPVQVLRLRAGRLGVVCCRLTSRPERTLGS